AQPSSSSLWRARFARRNSPPSHLPTSPAAQHIRGRSFTWSATRSTAACRRWPPPPCSARRAWRLSAVASSAGRPPLPPPALAADRIGAKRMIVFGLALQALSVSLYVFTRNLAGFYGLALMFGFAYGAVMPLYAILVREYFGARIMGTMFGAVNMASTLGMALGPWAGGWLFDAYGSYFWLYIGSFGIGLGAVAIALTFRPPREFSVG